MKDILQGITMLVGYMMGWFMLEYLFYDVPFDNTWYQVPAIVSLSLLIFGFCVLFIGTIFILIERKWK